MSTERIGSHVTIARDGRIANVVFDRGGGRNALSRALIRDLTAAAKRLRDETDISAVVLSAPGQFSVGADLKDADRPEGLPLAERRAALRAGPDLIDAWSALDQITIAAVEGWCLGGGLALAAACDLRVAARGARFRLPEVALGLNMSWHAVPRLVALMGPARATRLVALAEEFSAEAAHQAGLADAVVEDGAACDEARAIAARAAALPPVAVAMCKRQVAAASAALHATASFMDLDQFALAAASGDAAEAIAAFREKRTPDFKGG